MNFGEQIKSIREQHKLTQEELSQKLNISRQAVSNWENNRNLPDIEMLITITQVFHISLDQLILGGNNMNNMAEKLIKDGSETRRARLNTISACIGTALFIIGAACLGIKSASVEYLDSAGVLHENFFLIPIAFLFLLGGFITFFVTGVRNMVSIFCDKSKVGRKNQILYLCISASIIVLCALLLVLLRMANG